MPETFGQRLRYARELRGYDRPRFSRKSGIPLNSLYGYETDKHDMPLFTALVAADTLGISLDWLTGRKESMEVKK